MNEISDDLKLLPDSIFDENGLRRNRNELKQSAQKVLEEVLASNTLESSNVSKFLTFVEALQKGEPVVFPDEGQGKTEVHMFTPLSSKLKPEEVIGKYEYKDKRWYLPPKQLSPDYAPLVIMSGREVKGKSAQKLFVVVEPMGEVICYHYGVSPSGKPEGIPTEGFRADHVYYKKEELDSENVKGILVSIARELNLNVPTNAEQFDRPIAEYLPKYIGNVGKETSPSQ